MRNPNYIFILPVFTLIIVKTYAAPGFTEIRRMAELGDTIAQLNVGNSYYTGEGIPQNYDEAAKWYRIAARKGNAVAQNNLGMMYSIGVGVPKRFIRAYVWSSMAAAQGNDQAKKNRELVSRELTRAQLTRAQEMAQRCFNSDYQDCGR